MKTPNFLLKKEYPNNYSNEVRGIIETIELGTDIQVLGSMSIRSMKYASDYDLYDVVKSKSIAELERKVKKMLKRVLATPNLFIGDIKLGEKKEWKIIDDTAYINDRGKYVGYNPIASREKIKELHNQGVLSTTEMREGLKALKDKPTKEELMKINKMLRFHILRWTPKDILRGYLELRNGEKYELKKAFKDPVIFKIDFIALLNDGIFQEFNVVYDLRNVKGIRINTPHINTEETLKRDIELYSIVGNWFKVAKRLFSLYNYQLKYKKQNVEMIDKLERIYELLNSDLGIVYNIIQDIQVLKILIENERNIPIANIKNEVDGFIDRLSNVYSMNSYLKKERSILKQIEDILTSKTNTRIIATLDNIEERLNEILNKEAEKRIKHIR